MVQMSTGSGVGPSAAPNSLRQALQASMLPDIGLPGGDDLLGMTAHTPEAAGRPAPTPSGQPLPPAADIGRRSASAGPQTTSPPTSFASLGTALQQRGYVRGRSAGYGGRGGEDFGGRGRTGRGFGRGRGRGGSPHAGGAEADTGRQALGTRFVAEPLRAELQQRAYAVAAQLDPESQAQLGIPPSVQHYHSLYPLEPPAANATEAPGFGVRSQVLKGISGHSGSAFALRRISPQQLPPTGNLLAAAQEAVEAWSVVAQQPNLIVLRSAFVSSEVEGAPALFLVHDLHPGAVSLRQAHLQPTATATGLVQNNAPSEEVLWAYLVQLTSGLRAVHSADLVCHRATLSPSKVLLTSSGRVRIGSLGVADTLGAPPSSREELQQQQREDLAALGHLLLTLTCMGSGLRPSLDNCMAHYSMDLTRIISALLASPEGGGLGSWRGLAAALGERLFMGLDSAQLYADALLGELGTEADNGRLLRLCVRLSAVTERPEHEGDPQWSETGDRYLLKLFRDFVFHQMDEEGRPILDWGHMIEALNKLDAAVPEQVLLLSRDEMSMLVVSYADIARCLKGAYGELQARSAAPH